MPVNYKIVTIVNPSTSIIFVNQLNFAEYRVFERASICPFGCTVHSTNVNLNRLSSKC